MWTLVLPDAVNVSNVSYATAQFEPLWFVFTTFFRSSKTPDQRLPCRHLIFPSSPCTSVFFWVTTLACLSFKSYSSIESDWRNLILFMTWPEAISTQHGDTPLVKVYIAMEKRMFFMGVFQHFQVCKLLVITRGYSLHIWTLLEV